MVLLVEDDPIIALSLTQQLQAERYEVTHVTTGEEAVQMAREHQQRALPWNIDTILMDVNLGPGMDGITAAEEITSLRDVPVIFLTSLNPHEVMARSETIPSRWCVSKGDGVTTLLSVMEMVNREHTLTVSPHALHRSGSRPQLHVDTAFLHNVLDNMLDLVAVTDLHGNYIYVGKSHDRLGYTREALLKQNVLNNIHPDDIHWIQGAYAQFIESGEAHTAEYRYRKADGTYLWFETTATMLRDENNAPHSILFNTRDITQRRHDEMLRLQLSEAVQTLNAYTWESIDYQEIAETARRFAGARFASFNIHNNQEDTITTVAMAAPESAHRMASKLLGMSFIGRDWPSTYSRASREPGERTRHYSGLVEMLAGILPARGLSLVAKTFSLGSFSIVRTSRGERTFGEFNFLFSKDRHLENLEIVELYADMVGISLARIEAERKTADAAREKEMLLREVQHRIKNSLMTMGSLLSIQMNSVAEPASKAVLQDAHTRFKSLELLYSQLQYQGGDGMSGSVKEYLAQLIERAIAIAPDQRNITRHITLEDVSLDAKRLSALGMIINELVTNAIKHAFRERSGGTLTVTVDRAGDMLRTTVQDDGPGIPPGVDPARTTSVGMTLVNALARQLRGTVSFVSPADGGTIVSLSFPE